MGLLQNDCPGCRIYIDSSIEKMMRPTNSNAETAAPRRIVVTVDIESHLPSTIELAVAIAASQQGALHGLFIEDEDLLRAASLPFAREVPLTGGKPRTFDDRMLERNLANEDD